MITLALSRMRMDTRHFAFFLIRCLCLLFVSQNQAHASSQPPSRATVVEKTPGTYTMSDYLIKPSLEFSYPWEKIYGELKSSAETGREPIYLSGLFAIFDSKFQAWHSQKEFGMRHGIAVMLTWEAILKFASKLASKAAHTAVWSNEGDTLAAESSANSAALALASNILADTAIHPSDWGDTKDSIWEATLATTRAAAQVQGGDAKLLADQLCTDLLPDFTFDAKHRSLRGRLAYRASEIAVLLYLNRNFDSIADAAYYAAMNFLQERKLAQGTKFFVHSYLQWVKRIEAPLANHSMSSRMIAPLLTFLSNLDETLALQSNESPLERVHSSDTNLSLILEQRTEENLTETFARPATLEPILIQEVKTWQDDPTALKLKAALLPTLYFSAVVLCSATVTAGFFLSTCCP